MTNGEPEQAEKHLRRDEGVPACGVAVVRNHAEHVAQRIEREVPDRRAARQPTIPLDVQAVRVYEGYSALKKKLGLTVVSDLSGNDSRFAAVGRPVAIVVSRLWAS